MTSLLSQIAHRLGKVFKRDRTPLPGVSLRQSLYTRIGFGYIVAIGIGVCGSLTGLIVADIFQGVNVERLFLVQNKSNRLDALQTAVARAEARALRLDVFPQSARKRKSQIETFDRQMMTAIAVVRDFQAWAEAAPPWLFENEPDIDRLLEGYAKALEDYRAPIVERLGALEEQSAAEDAEMLRLALNRVIRSATLDVLDLYYEKIESMRRRAQGEERRRSEAMEVIQGYEKGVVGFSVLFSACIAGVLAWRTTRNIVNPIAQTAAVAQQAANDADYTLRAPIVTKDEIAKLGASLNYLIERVGQRTEELRSSERTTLERNQALQNAMTKLASTQSQLVQTEKMSSLGQLVAGVAHEINNPMNFIHGNVVHARDYISDILELLDAYQERYPDDEEMNALAEDLDIGFSIGDMPKLLDSLSSGTERIRDIVQSLRTFSRLDEAEFKNVDLHAGIDSTLLMLSSRLKTGLSGASIEVRKDYGELPLVSCYANQVNQVVMNLVANAIEDAAEVDRWTQVNAPTPIVEIRTRRRDDSVEIQIADNALGIPQEARSRLFDPFFTTKDVGRGTGLGLSICYTIVTETHGGKLHFDSTIGVGTTFHILLPLERAAKTASISPIVKAQPEAV